MQQQVKQKEFRPSIVLKYNKVNKEGKELHFLNAELTAEDIAFIQELAANLKVGDRLGGKSLFSKFQPNQVWAFSLFKKTAEEVAKDKLYEQKSKEKATHLRAVKAKQEFGDIEI